MTQDTLARTSGLQREIVGVDAGIAAADGDGVKLTRMIGHNRLSMIDPFLLFDVIESDQSADYVGGFPDHPHRGFETVTYLLNGRVRHKDNAGHEGVVGPGDVQWMTAGRGIVHSEMPEQENGLLHGFQLWVNLPREDKMTAPRYQEYASDEIPVAQIEGGTVKVVSGLHSGTAGPVRDIATNPLYLDVALDADKNITQDIAAGHDGFIYVIDGTVAVGEREIGARRLGMFGPGDAITVSARNGAARFLLIAGRRLGEPVARGGPFVMNTQEEILQAFDDFRRGRF